MSQVAIFQRTYAPWDAMDEGISLDAFIWYILLALGLPTLASKFFFKSAKEVVSTCIDIR